MGWLKSWRGLIWREYLEHRLPFLWFPLGILALFLITAVGSIFSNRVPLPEDFSFDKAPPVKIFELGFLLLIGLWLIYLAIALFFYYGDSFNADRRNNGMLFWKSMPVSDLKVLFAKFLAGMTLFPLLIYVIALISGILFYVTLIGATLILPGFRAPTPLQALSGFGHVGVFGLYYMFVAALWYAPFFAWVAGLSTVFGRWSLPLAFVIPGVLAVMENMVAYSYVPRGGYILGYLSKRWQFGLNEYDYGFLVASPIPFDLRTYVFLLNRDVNWTELLIGLAFTLVVIWLASQYRRRRIK